MAPLAPSFARPSDAEMMLGEDFSGEDEPVAVQQPKRLLVKSLIGAAVLGGVAFCGLRSFASNESEPGSVHFGDHRIELAEAMHPHVAVVGGLMKAWGDGAFHGDACMEKAKEHFTDDVVTDATAPANYADMYKKYHGIAGLCEWCANLEKFNFSTFKIEEMYPSGDDKVLAQATYVPTLISGGTTGEPNEDGQIWTVKDGKVSAVTFVFTEIAKIDSLFYAEQRKKEISETSAVDVVGEIFKMWGEGKFAKNDDACKEASKPVVSDSFESSKWGPITEDLTGLEGWCKMGATLAGYKFTDMQPPVLMKRAPEEVIMVFKYKLDGESMHDQHLWTVEGGKVTKHEAVISDIKAYD